MNAYEELLLRLVQEEPNLMILTAENRGHLRSIPEHLGDRFLDVGIAEQTMIGMAAGMAVRGRVVVTHALSAFLTMRAYEFIRDDVGISNASVILVGMVPGLLSDGNGPTHQAIEDVAIMRGIPNVGVFCPSDIEEFVEGMEYLIADGKPFYVRYIGSPREVEHIEPFIPGLAEVVYGSDNIHSDITILTYGFMLHQVISALSHLHTDRRTVRVVNMRTLKPIDENRIRYELASSDLVVSVEDHLRTGGLFSIVSEISVGMRHHAPVEAIAFDTWFKPGRLRDVLQYEKLDAPSIASRIEKFYSQHLQETAQND